MAPSKTGAAAMSCSTEVRSVMTAERSGLTSLSDERVAGSPLDQDLVALGGTIRHYCGAVTRFDMDTHR